MEKYAPAVDEGTRVAFLMPIKDGDKVVNDDLGNGGEEGKGMGMYIEIPEWTSEVLKGAELVPVYTFQHQKVCSCSPRSRFGSRLSRVGSDG